MQSGRERLEQIKRFDRLIANKTEEADRLLAMSVKISAAVGSEDRVQCSPKQDSMAESIIALIDLRTEINQLVKKYIELKCETMKLVDSLRKSEYIDVLYKRYFQYKTWETIAVEMGYTYQWVVKLHGRALQAFDAIDKKS